VLSDEVALGDITSDGALIVSAALRYLCGVMVQ
jgi:hypothetical protein